MAFADPTMAIQGAMILTTKSTVNVIYFVNILTTLIVVFTALCDWQIKRLNRRLRKRRDRIPRYNLSLNFQLNENIMAMRLILPLDIAYATIYLLYNSLVILLRFYKDEISSANYVFYYSAINALQFIYTAGSFIVYIRFIKFIRQNQKRTFDLIKKQKVEHARIYFRELEKQWE
uniref:G_PROTEIN_RECEP_F1_2 domain-containing protein n=1 Tax=Meloidogyne hapla TaxID=6305 RepID=A0A1I8BK99_MELHA